MPDKVEGLVREIASLQHVRVEGLMAVGPLLGDAEQLRPHFRRMKQLFDHLAALGLPGVEMKYLSMGMTDSYHIAIQEGANMVRIGTRIFGPRH